MTLKKTNLSAVIRNMKPGSTRKIPRATTTPQTVRSTIARLREDNPALDGEYSTKTTPNYTIVTRKENNPIAN